MSDNSKNDSASSKSGDDKPFVDRRKSSGGISDGGRRAADSRKFLSKSARFWFGLSLALTVAIMIWTFSIPFRSEKPMFAWEKPKSAKESREFSDEIKQHPEFNMASEEYLTYVMDLEYDLQARLAEKNLVPQNLPDRHVVEQKAVERKKAMKDQLQTLEEFQTESESGEFSSKDIRAQAMKDLQQRLESDEG